MKQENRKRFRIFGRVTLDCYAIFDKYPPSISLANYAKIKSANIFPGGSATNTALWLSSLGGEVEMHAAFGRDFAGEFVCDSIRSKGISLKCQYIDRPTSISFIFLDNRGEPHFLHSPGANDLFDPSVISGVSDEDIVYIGGVNLMHGLSVIDWNRLIQIIKGKPKVIAAGLCHGGKRGNLLNILSGIQILFGTYEEFSRYKDSPEGLFNLSPSLEVIIMTKGRKGVTIFERSRINNIPTEAIIPVDACGAGDSFVAGFLTGLAQNQSIEESCSLGNLISAINCMTLGPSNPPADLGNMLLDRFPWLPINDN